MVVWCGLTCPEGAFSQGIQWPRPHTHTMSGDTKGRCFTTSRWPCPNPCHNPVTHKSKQPGMIICNIIILLECALLYYGEIPSNLYKCQACFQHGWPGMNEPQLLWAFLRVSPRPLYSIIPAQCGDKYRSLPSTGSANQWIPMGEGHPSPQGPPNPLVIPAWGEASCPLPPPHYPNLTHTEFPVSTINGSVGAMEGR